MKNTKYDSYGVTLEVGEQFEKLSDLYDYLGEDYHDYCSPSDFVGVWHDEDLYKALCDFAGDKIEDDSSSDCYVLDVLNNYTRTCGYHFDFVLFDEDRNDLIFDCSILPDGTVTITDIK